MNREQQKAMFAKLYIQNKNKFVVKDLSGKPYYGDKGTPWQDWENKDRLNIGIAHKMWDQLPDNERDYVLSKALGLVDKEMQRWYSYFNWTQFTPAEQTRLFKTIVSISDKTHKQFLIERAKQEETTWGSNHPFVKRYTERL